MTTIVQPDGARRAPEPGPPRIISLPTPVERTLAGGLRVIAFQQRTGPKALGVPLIAAQLILGGGSAAENESEAGLASLCAALLTQGTAARTAFDIAQAIDALGARLDAGSGFDASVASVSATTPVFERAFALLSEIVRTPAFEDGEFERVRAKTINDLTLTYSNPSSLARLVMQRVAFAGAPYGHPQAGTAATLAALTRERVVAYHERFFRPDNATLIIGGDIAADAAFALAERVLGDWRAPASPLVRRAAVEAPAPRSRVIIIDKPDAGRTAVLVGRVGIARKATNFPAATVATAVLSGYSGRLNQAIRVQRGLSYGAGAQLSARHDPGLFVASTLVDHTKVAEATDVMLATLRDFAAEPIDPAKLATKKIGVTGSFYRGIETIDGIASTLGELALYDVPLDDLNRYVPRIEAIDVADVHRFAQFVTRECAVVLVGRAETFADAISAAYDDVATIPFAKLDLGAAL